MAIDTGLSVAIERWTLHHLGMLRIDDSKAGSSTVNINRAFKQRWSYDTLLATNKVRVATSRLRFVKRNKHAV